MLDINEKIKLIPTDFATQEERDFWASFNKHMPYVVEIMPIVAYYCDSHQRIVYANNKALDAIQVPAHQIIGHTPLNYYPEAIARETVNSFDYVYTSRQMFDDYHYVTDFVTGSPKTFKATLDPLFNPETGNLMGLFGISIEVFDKPLSKLENVDNNKRLAIIHQDNKVRDCVEDIYSVISKWRVELFNNNLGITNNQPIEVDKIELSNQEREILYFLSNHKSLEEISQLFMIIKNQEISSLEIEKIIIEQLYCKFGAFNIPQLVEKAYLSGEITFFV